jgi:hypothetical protein
MTTLRVGIGVAALGVGFAAFATFHALERRDPPSSGTVKLESKPIWTEVKWPFPLDQWGTGRAFTCAAAHCGTEVNIYIRPKIGFCNCATGVSDDAELDRVGDLDLYSDRFKGIGKGRVIVVGSMRGRSRPYQIDMRYGAPRAALAMAFNDKCDVMVATVAAGPEHLGEAERVGVDFLNSDRVLRWVESELGSS